MTTSLPKYWKLDNTHYKLICLASLLENSEPPVHHGRVEHGDEGCHTVSAAGIRNRRANTYEEIMKEFAGGIAIVFLAIVLIGMMAAAGQLQVWQHRLIKCWCFIKGHDMITLYTLNNAHSQNEPPRSTWGKHMCVRCGKTEEWQYDH